MALRSVNQNAFMAIYEAEAKRMEQLFRAWDQEIARGFEALREDQKKQNAEKLSEYTAAQRQYHQDQAADIAASVLLQRLGHAEVLAETGLAVAIPEGLKVASSVVHGPSLGELGTVLAELQEELNKPRDKDDAFAAQASLAFALQSGMLPHPGELGRLIDAVGIAPDKAKELIDLGAKLDRTSESGFSHPRLRYEGAAEKLDVLRQTKNELQAIGGKTLLKLAFRPESLRGQPLSYSPVTSPQTGMTRHAFDQMLSGLFAGKK